MITFNELPFAVYKLCEDMALIKEVLLKPTSANSSPEEFLTIQEAGKFLMLSKATIYGLTSKGLIPFMKKRKRIYFSKDELITYIKEGKRKTNAEIEAEADLFLGSQKRRRVNHG